MAEPFLGEIRILNPKWNTPTTLPRGWAFCNGQLLPKSDYESLFSLLGTMYGGNGSTNFALPDLRGRVPIHRGNGHVLAETGGEQSHIVTIGELPEHNHIASASASQASTNVPAADKLLAASNPQNAWGPASNLVSMSSAAVANQGGGQAHLNLQPYLALDFCIALQGITPSTTQPVYGGGQPYIGEIRMFAGNFAPAGWQFCEGQLVPIDEYDILFDVIGTSYGGDGSSTFALPDLRARIPLHEGNGFVLADKGGVEDVTLTVQQIPAHSHPLMGTANLATTASPRGNVPAAVNVVNTALYGTDAPAQNVNPASIGSTGGSQPHNNLQPYLPVNFIISLYGLFPSA